MYNNKWFNDFFTNEDLMAEYIPIEWCFSLDIQDEQANLYSWKTAFHPHTAITGGIDENGKLCYVAKYFCDIKVFSGIEQAKKWIEELDVDDYKNKTAKNKLKQMQDEYRKNNPIIIDEDEENNYVILY